MACASVQCKITNRIDLNLICLCLSVSIQHVQATRLIYSVSNVFAKTNLKEIFSLLCVKYNSNLLIELKNIISFQNMLFYIYGLNKKSFIDCLFFSSFCEFCTCINYSKLHVKLETGKQVGERITLTVITSSV